MFAPDMLENNYSALLTNTLIVKKNVFHGTIFWDALTCKLDSPESILIFDHGIDFLLVSGDQFGEAS